MVLRHGRFMSPGEKIIFGLLILGYGAAQADKVAGNRLTTKANLLVAAMMIGGPIFMLYGLGEIVHSWLR